MKEKSNVFEHNGVSFTLREAEVLLCCAEGMTIQETAERLSIASGTVRKHHNNLSLRFGLHGYHGLTFFAVGMKQELEKYAL